MDDSCIAIREDCKFILTTHKKIEDEQNSIGEARKEASNRLTECKQKLDVLNDNYNVEEALAMHRKLTQCVSRAATFSTEEKKEEFMKGLKELEELVNANKFVEKKEEEKEAEAQKRKMEQMAKESSSSNNKSGLVQTHLDRITLPSMKCSALPTAPPSPPPTLSPTLPAVPSLPTPPAFPTASAPALPPPPPVPVPTQLTGQSNSCDNQNTESKISASVSTPADSRRFNDAHNSQTKESPPPKTPKTHFTKDGKQNPTKNKSCKPKWSCAIF